MLFYRVETDKCEGPYRNNLPQSMGDYLSSLNKMEDYTYTHPLPENEPEFYLLFWNPDHKKRQYMYDYIFGFSDIDKIFDWFYMDEEMDYLKANNFHVSVYETEVRHDGEYQSVARKDSIKKIEEISF